MIFIPDSSILCRALQDSLSSYNEIGYFSNLSKKAINGQKSCNQTTAKKEVSSLQFALSLFVSGTVINAGDAI